MKDFTKKRLFKSLLSVLMVGLIVVPTNVFATTTLSGQAKIDPTTTTTKLISIFPSFRKSLDKYTTGKLVSSKEMYIKYTPKSTASTQKIYTSKDDIKNNFEIKAYTPQQYTDETSKTFLTASSIGGQQGAPCSWLKTTLQVYNRTTAGTYMAYNFSSWLKTPYLHLTDAIGLSFGNGLVASGDAASRHAEYNYNNVSNQATTFSPGVQINSSSGNGVMAAFSLYRYAPHGKEFNDAMISTGVQFSGNGTDSGWISANYSHAQLAIGSVGFTGAGLPSMGIGADIHQVSVFVTK